MQALARIRVIHACNIHLVRVSARTLLKLIMMMKFIYFYFFCWSLCDHMHLQFENFIASPTHTFTYQKYSANAQNKFNYWITLRCIFTLYIYLFICIWFERKKTFHKYLQSLLIFIYFFLYELHNLCVNLIKKYDLEQMQMFWYCLWRLFSIILEE